MTTREYEKKQREWSRALTRVFDDFDKLRTAEAKAVCELEKVHVARYHLKQSERQIRLHRDQLTRIYNEQPYVQRKMTLERLGNQ